MKLEFNDFAEIKAFVESAKTKTVCKLCEKEKGIYIGTGSGLVCHECTMTCYDNAILHNLPERKKECKPND